MSAKKSETPTSETTPETQALENPVDSLIENQGKKQGENPVENLGETLPETPALKTSPETPPKNPEAKSTVADKVLPPQTPDPEPCDLEPRDIDELIVESDLPVWQGAALCRAENWAPGLKITKDEFSAALSRLSSRRLGG